MVMVKRLTMMFALVVVSIYVDQVDKACQEREKRRECFLLQNILLFLGTAVNSLRQQLKCNSNLICSVIKAFEKSVS